VTLNWKQAADALTAGIVARVCEPNVPSVTLIAGDVLQLSVVEPTLPVQVKVAEGLIVCTVKVRVCPVVVTGVQRTATSWLVGFAVVARLATVSSCPGEAASAGVTGWTNPMNRAATMAIATDAHKAFVGPGLFLSVIVFLPPKVEVETRELWNDAS
jgi:hypothetical protein